MGKRRENPILLYLSTTTSKKIFAMGKNRD
jgi:hypothetical protein